jgi:hypothetical protein
MYFFFARFLPFVLFCLLLCPSISFPSLSSIPLPISFLYVPVCILHIMLFITFCPYFRFLFFRFFCYFSSTCFIYFCVSIVLSSLIYFSFLKFRGVVLLHFSLFLLLLAIPKLWKKLPCFVPLPLTSSFSFLRLVLFQSSAIFF